MAMVAIDGECVRAGYTAATDRFLRLVVDATPRGAQEWARLEPEARVGKFFLACVEDERLLGEMQRLLGECMEEGVQEAEFVHRASRMLAELEGVDGRPYYDPVARQAMGEEERLAYDRDVRHVDSAARLKLVFRTQYELGAGYAEWQRATDAEHLRRYPAWQFVRQPGAKVKRADHEEHEDDVRLIADVEYWLERNRPEIGGFNQPHGPWGYNSWMRTRYVSRAECERLGLLAPGEVVEMPPEAQRYDLARVVMLSNTASLEGLTPEAQQRVRARCEQQGLRLVPDMPERLGDDELVEDLLRLIALLEDGGRSVWDDLLAAHCNQYGHVPGCQKGTTREARTRGEGHRVHKVNQRLPMHKQVAELADAIMRAARDGERLEAVIYRPEFGELTLDCGNPGRKNDSQDSRGHGVQHALEGRHNLDSWDIAHTLLTGSVVAQDGSPSRLRVETEQVRVVLEREMQKGSGRISSARAKLHTAMRK